MEIEPLEALPVAVLEGQYFPEIALFDWVVERVKNLCHAVGLSYEGVMRSKCWHYLQLLKQIGRRVVWRVLHMFWQRQIPKEKENYSHWHVQSPMMQTEGHQIKIKEGGGAFVCLMIPKILSWNVRGLNLEKRKKIKGLIGEWKSDIVCLQETKLQVVNREMVRSL
jgi:hypothetical protein